MPYIQAPELPFQSESDTSREAAIRAQRFVGEQGSAVLAWCRTRGELGATQRECADALKIGRPSICARFRALELSGALVKTSERRAGCVVYRVTGM